VTSGTGCAFLFATVGATASIASILPVVLGLAIDDLSFIALFWLLGFFFFAVVIFLTPFYLYFGRMSRPVQTVGCLVIRRAPISNNNTGKPFIEIVFQRYENIPFYIRNISSHKIGSKSFHFKRQRHELNVLHESNRFL
jgi:hypothetical protein